ncbi:MAG: hypothetical protein KBA30_10420 [Clostridia bacterium]|nr:hypothetical protein [Clostridia bacterium]
MDKGIVMEIKGRHAMVFSKECGLVRMPLRRDMYVGQAVRIGDAAASAPAASAARPAVAARYRRRWVAGLAMAAACLVLIGALGVFMNGILSARTVAVVMSVDINPSLNMMLNRDHKVIAVQARNEEAERLLEGTTLQGLDYEAALECWIQVVRERWEGDLSQVLVSAAFEKPDAAFAEVLLQLEEVPAVGPLAGLDVWVVYSNDNGIADQAEENGLSVGRQLLMNRAVEGQPGYRAEDVAQAKLGELIQTMLERGKPDLSTGPAGNAGETTRSASDPSGSTVRETSRETSQETNRETVQTGSGTGATSRETVRETVRETAQTGSGGQGGPDGSAPTIGGSEPSGSTVRETVQATVRTTDPSGTGTPSPSTLQSGAGPTATSGMGTPKP